MRRGLRSQTIDVQTLQHQQSMMAQQSPQNYDLHFQDQPSFKQKQSQKQQNNNKQQCSNKKNKNSKSEKQQQKQNGNEGRLSIRNLLKYVEQSQSKDIYQSKKEENVLNDYIKNVITVHNDKYKYYANDINSSHNYINYSTHKKSQEPILKAVLAQKISEIDYLPYQPQISNSYWANISKKSTGKNNTSITPYVFRQSCSKGEAECYSQRPQSQSSRVSSSCSTSRKNSLIGIESVGQSLDADLQVVGELQTNSKDKSFNQIYRDSVKNNLTYRNSLGSESKTIKLPTKRQVPQSSSKEKRVQSARVHKAMNKQSEQNQSQLSIHPMYYSSLFQENSIHLDMQHSKDSFFGFQRPNQVDINNSVIMPVEDEIFNTRQNFMRGNTLKNNWMNKLQQQIKQKRIQVSQDQAHKSGGKSNAQQIESKPQTARQQNMFCLNNEFIKKRSSDIQFSLLNSMIVDKHNLRKNSKQNIGETSLISNRSEKNTDENRLSITSICLQDNFKDLAKNSYQLLKQKQINPVQQNQGNKTLDMRIPLSIHNHRSQK